MWGVEPKSSWHRNLDGSANMCITNENVPRFCWWHIETAEDKIALNTGWTSHWFDWASYSKLCESRLVQSKKHWFYRWSLFGVIRRWAAAGPTLAASRSPVRSRDIMLSKFTHATSPLLHIIARHPDWAEHPAGMLPHTHHIMICHTCLC